MSGASPRGAVIDVVAAVVTRGDRVLLCQRHDEPHLPLLWEFPGGKIDPGESPRTALTRELAEELGVAASVEREIADVRHDYPEKRVRIRFFTASIRGEPDARVHRQLRWIPCGDLGRYEVPAANASVVRMLVERGLEGNRSRTNANSHGAAP